MINCPAPSYLPHFEPSCLKKKRKKKLSTTLWETISVVSLVESKPGGSGAFRDGKRLFVSRINEGMRQWVLRAAIKSPGPRGKSRNCSLMSQSRVRGNVGRKDYTTYCLSLFLVPSFPPVLPLV